MADITSLLPPPAMCLKQSLVPRRYREIQHESSSTIDRLIIPQSHMVAIGYEGGAEGLLTLAKTQDSTSAHVIPPAISVTLRISVGRNTAVLHVFQARGPATARGVSLPEFLRCCKCPMHQLALTRKPSGSLWPGGEAGPQGGGRSSSPLRPSHPTAACPLLPIQ